MSNSTVIDYNALVEALEANKKEKDKDTAYRFSNGREFERPQDPYA